MSLFLFESESRRLFFPLASSFKVHLKWHFQVSNLCALTSLWYKQDLECDWTIEKWEVAYQNKHGGLLQQNEL